jgi:glycosyltransferase involved in cell wall biosynthesis
MDIKKVSCVMCTYGRFKTVERSLSFFFEQDYLNKELIIFNTAPVPLESDLPIKIINNQISYITGKPYTSIGQVRADALTHATGDLYVCWDDDDLYAPYHLSQSIERYNACGKKAWKPRASLYTSDAGLTFSKMENNMEASIIVDIACVEFGLDKTGDEHIRWLDKLRDEKQIEEMEYVKPSYCYFWGDGLHKQSGNIKSPNNFEEHKAAEQDFGDRKLRMIDVSEFHKIWS